MKRMKRLICLLTVLCMVVSMAGFTAFAEGTLIGTVTFEGTLPTVVAGQEAPERPILKDRIAVAVKQFELSERDHGEHIACLEARKHFVWYLRGVRNASYYKKEITSMNKMEDIYRIARDIVRDLE